MCWKEKRGKNSVQHMTHSKNQAGHLILTKNMKLTRKIKIAFSNKVTVKSTKKFQVHVREEMQNQLIPKFTELLGHK